MRSLIGQTLLTVVIGATGVAAFWAIHLPLPFLFGPMAACLLAALLRAPLRGFGQVSIGARSILGVAIGASLTPDLLDRLPEMLASLAIVPVYIASIALIGIPFFERVCGFDRKTAFYAAMPGGAADMTLFGQQAGANLRQLSLVHVTRLLVIMVVAPIVMVKFYGANLSHPVGEPAAALPVSELLMMIGAAVLGWKGGERIGLFGSAIIGPLVVAAVLSLAGLLHARPPKEALLAAQFLIGTGIGVSYVGVTFRELRETIVGGATFVLILALLAAAATEIVTLSGLAPPTEGFLAFTPGGQAEMAMLAILSGADLGFVIAHHLVRVMLVILGAPILFRVLARGKLGDGR
jgi:membrane AbrB-like protein